MVRKKEPLGVQKPLNFKKLRGFFVSLNTLEIERIIINRSESSTFKS
jgi:hypothetical protein